MELEKLLENYSGNLEKLVQYITGATPDLVDLETLALGSANSLQEEINSRLATLREFQKRRGSQLLKQVTESADPTAFDTSSFGKSLMRESLQVNFLRKDQTELQEELNALRQLHAGSKNPMEKFVEEIQAKVGVEGQKLEIEDSIEMLLVKKVAALEKKVASKFKKELDSVKHTVGVIMCDYLKKIEQLDLQCVSSKKLNEDTVQKLNHYMTLTRQFKKTQSLSQERYDHLTMLMSKLKETNYKVIRNLQKKLEAARRQLAEQGRFGYLLSNEEGRDAADDEEYEYFTQSNLPQSNFEAQPGFKVGEDSSNLFDSTVGFDSRPLAAIPPAGYEYEEMIQESATYQAPRRNKSPNKTNSDDGVHEDLATSNPVDPETEEFELVQGRGALNILKRNEMGGAARLPKGMLERLQQLIAELEEKEKQLIEALRQTQGSSPGTLNEGGDANNPQDSTQGTETQTNEGQTGENKLGVSGTPGKAVPTTAGAAQSRPQVPVLKETQYKNDQKALLLYIKQVEAERQKWAQSLARVQELYRRTEGDRQRRAQQADALALRLSRMLAVYNQMRERNPDLLPDGEATEDTLEQKQARLVEEFEQLRAKDDNPVAKLQTQNSKLRYELDDLRKELRFREDELALKKAEIRKLYEMSRFGLATSKAPVKGKGQSAQPSESSVAERLYAKTLQFNDDLKDQLMSQKKKTSKLEDELYDYRNRERRLERKLQDLNGQQREVTYIVYAGKKVEIDELEGLIDDLNNTLQRKQQKIERLQNELLDAQEMMNISYQSDGQDSEDEEDPRAYPRANQNSDNFDPNTKRSPSKIVSNQEDSLPPKPKKRRFESDKKQEFKDYDESQLGEQAPSRRPKRVRPAPQDPTQSAVGQLAVSQPVDEVPASAVPLPVVPTRVVPVAPQYDPRVLERANSLQQALDQMRAEKRELEQRSQQAIQDYKNLQDQNEKLQTTTIKLQSQVSALQSQLLSNDSKVTAFAEQLIKVNRENEGLKLINSQLDQAARQTTPRGDTRINFPDKSEVWEGMPSSGQPRPNSALEEDSLEETVIKVGKENQDLREKLRVLDGQLKNSQQTVLLNGTTIKGLEARITELGNELAMKENQIKSFQTFNTKSMEKQATTVTDGAPSVAASPITRKKDSVGVQVETMVDLQPQVQQAQQHIQEQDYELAELRKQLEELTEQYEYSESCLNELRQTLARVFAKKQYLINVLVNIEEDLYIAGRPIKRLDEAALERLLDEALEVVRGENQFRKSFTVPTKSSLDVVEIKLDTTKQAEFEVASAKALEGSVDNAAKLNQELFRLGEEVTRLRSIIQEYVAREEEFRRFAVDLVQANSKNDSEHAEDYKRLLTGLQNLDIEDEEELRPSDFECFRHLLVYLNEHPGRGHLVDRTIEQNNQQAFEHQEPQDATYDDELLLEVLRQQHEFQSNMERMLAQRLGSYRQTLENTRAQGADMRKVQHIEKLAVALEPFVSPTAHPPVSRRLD